MAEKYKNAAINMVLNLEKTLRFAYRIGLWKGCSL